MFHCLFLLEPHLNWVDFHITRYIGWSNITRCSVLGIKNPEMATRCCASFFVMRFQAMCLLLWWKYPRMPLITGHIKFSLKCRSLKFNRVYLPSSGVHVIFVVSLVLFTCISHPLGYIMVISMECPWWQKWRLHVCLLVYVTS